MLIPSSPPHNTGSGTNGESQAGSVAVSWGFWKADSVAVHLLLGLSDGVSGNAKDGVPCLD
jgi:hypothetical protein